MAKVKAKRRIKASGRLCLLDLPGKPGTTMAVGVRSITEAMKFIRRGEAVTADDNAGALNVWPDNNGNWRAEFHRFRITFDSVMPATKKDIRAWLRQWWPKLTKAE